MSPLLKVPAAMALLLASLSLQAADALDVAAADIARIADQFCELDYMHLDSDGSLRPNSINRKAALGYAGNLSPEGSWPDVDYKHQGRTWWGPMRHTHHMLQIALACRSEHDPVLEEAFHRALAFWLKAGLKGPNWWSNEIGAPDDVSNACLLMDAWLGDEERAAVVAYLRGSAKKPDAYTGQNRVWIANIALRRDLLARDAAGVIALRAVIGSEIRVGKGPEGIRSDGCFHQHGPQPQFCNYGLAFLSKAATYAQAFTGTPLDWSDEQYAALRLLVGEGYRWILWRGRVDPAHIGRQRFAEASATKGRSALLSIARLGATGRSEFTALRDAIFAENLGDGTGTAFTGYKFFRDSAFSVYRAPEWMASVKMHTPSITGTEIVNEEDCFGGHVADGGLFTSVTGREYENVYPLWNWRRIPGITSLDGVPPSQAKPKERNASHFVRGASEGAVGITAMTCDREGLVSHKAWIFTPDFVLCLGAGITSDRTEPVVTTVEQANRTTPVRVLDRDAGAWRDVSGAETLRGEDVRALHAGSGYIVRTPSADVAIASEHRSGDYKAFMHAVQPTPHEGDVFELAILHGAAPKNAAYEYWVLPRTDEASLAAFDPAAAAVVLRNDAEEQVVRLPGYGLVCRIVRTGENPGIRFEKDAE